MTNKTLTLTLTEDQIYTLYSALISTPHDDEATRDLIHKFQDAIDDKAVKFDFTNPLT